MSPPLASLARPGLQAVQATAAPPVTPAKLHFSGGLQWCPRSGGPSSPGWGPMSPPSTAGVASAFDWGPAFGAILPPRTLTAQAPRSGSNWRRAPTAPTRGHLQLVPLGVVPTKGQPPALPESDRHERQSMLSNIRNALRSRALARRAEHPDKLELCPEHVALGNDQGASIEDADRSLGEISGFNSPSSATTATPPSRYHVFNVSAASDVTLVATWLADARRREELAATTPRERPARTQQQVAVPECSEEVVSGAADQLQEKGRSEINASTVKVDPSPLIVAAASALEHPRRLSDGARPVIDLPIPIRTTPTTPPEDDVLPVVQRSVGLGNRVVHPSAAEIQSASSLGGFDLSSRYQWRVSTADGSPGSHYNWEQPLPSTAEALEATPRLSSTSRQAPHRLGGAGGNLVSARRQRAAPADSPAQLPTIKPTPLQTSRRQPRTARKRKARQSPDPLANRVSPESPLRSSPTSTPRLPGTRRPPVGEHRLPVAAASTGFASFAARVSGAHDRRAHTARVASGTRWGSGGPVDSQRFGPVAQSGEKVVLPKVHNDLDSGDTGPTLLWSARGVLHREWD
mmetsp:Transcript_7365/g.15777  ORF Transcript_7365/g.15777 Transcript_7365/m.15777 type:complete len:575 (+) Transcript_7365:3-1727(+)